MNINIETNNIVRRIVNYKINSKFIILLYRVNNRIMI
jgi:hypothetical protein